MSEKFFAEKLFELGYIDLVSVIPPGAQLVPSSKINEGSLGKIPGKRTKSGLWHGYNWRVGQPTIDDVRQWTIDGANVGLRADFFPGIDIDSADDRIAQVIEDAAIATLGTAPIRTGRAPKRLLVYRTEEPFSRMRLWITTPAGDTHLVEVLGQGSQYLVSGTHPGTLRAYTWDRELPYAGELTLLTRERAADFLTHLEGVIELSGIGTTKREGDGRPSTRVAASDQSGLLAPSLELLTEAVELIPNTSDLFPDRTSYLRMGYAIKSSAGAEHEDAAYELYSSWASRWNDGSNDPEVVRADWRRMSGSKAVGWSWIAEQARAFGFDDASLDFDALEDAPAETPITAPLYSDQWLASRLAEQFRGVLRFVPETGKYLAWFKGAWKQDGELQAEDLIKRGLRAVAADVLRADGTSIVERREAAERAERICSASKANAVAQFLRSERSIAVSVGALDHDPWVLNTPDGIVDLKTGQLSPNDPDALCTKSTSVPPDFSGSAPHWKRFLAEATGGNVELEKYLQRLAGYALTGITREQHLSFIYGEGGNGKGTYLNTIAGVMGDYARTADMGTFTASRVEKHSTDLAMLVGARLVTASETEAGKRWDEAKVKSLTGGDPVTARFMYQNNFTYFPQFKLVFIGNHRPEIRTVDVAMKRRIQMVPFNVRPVRVDNTLNDTLRGEWPAILAWMIQGCLMWQQEGLNPPTLVRAATDEYFRNEDAIGRWLDESTTADEQGTATMQDMYASYREWARENGEYAMTLKRLSTALAARKLEKWKHPENRRAGFKGISIINRLGVEFN